MTFLKQLKLNDLKGLGGFLLDEIQESLPRCDKILKVSIIIFFIFQLNIKLLIYFLLLNLDC